MQKTSILILVLFFLGISLARAQFVTIPDANFVNYLNTVIPSAMSGNQMDTTNAAVLSITRIDVENKGISNLSGVQYFKALVTLDCGNGSPSVDSNHLTSLPTLPNTLDTLICGNNQLTSLPILPGGLRYLACYINQLTSLPTLPATLKYLDCNTNLIVISLPALPGALTYLNCSINQLTSLPTLPVSLTYLDCSINQLASLPTLPVSLWFIGCELNQLTALPSLSNSITVLYCNDNQLASVPTLPNTLEAFDCSYNLLISLPTLPNTITDLGCENNQLTSLPALPGSLLYLLCENNQLTSLPALPGSLLYLLCENNQLTSLPALPLGLYQLWCDNNNISCFPIFPHTIISSYYFNLSGNPFTCLPNYIPAMDAGTLAFPLCLPGNLNGCSSAIGIVGFTYKDTTSYCVRDSGSMSLINIPMKVYDNHNTLLSQTYSAVNGVYDLPYTANTYKVLVDTSGLKPFIAQCPYPGLDSIVTVASLDTNVNFSLTCPGGFDVGVQSVVATGLIFPGMQHTLSVVAGDISHWYNLNCAKGDSGTVQITLTGPVTYVGPGIGALTPIVTGNVFTYHIADYGTINNTTAFNLILQTDVSARAGDTICAYVTVTPLVDNNPSNNTYQYCYNVINSHDPNMKEVYPVNVKPDYDGWFTYTIHFQNTGSSPAKNILLTDALDPNLDVTTFQLINYSYQNTTSLTGDLLYVRFSGINLPDSIANPSGSTGFIQYRIKPKAGLTNGTIIKNTAYIYFDYNAAIVTNTTQNLFTNSVASVNNIVASISSTLFPNPNNGKFTISLSNISEKSNMEIFNMLGENVYTARLNATNTQLDLSNNAAGIYLYRVLTETGELVSDGKFVIQ